MAAGVAVTAAIGLVFYAGSSAFWWVAAGAAALAAALLLTVTAIVTRFVQRAFSRRDQMGLAVRDSEANFRLLAQHAYDMICRVGPDGERHYVSPASLRLLQAAPDHLLGLSLWDYVHPEDRPMVEAVVSKLLTGESAAEAIIFRIVTADGSERWMEAVGQSLVHPATGEPDGYVSAWRDVTSRKLAERQLAESEARYRLLAETSADLITSLDLQLRRTYVSPACRSMLGFAAAEMMELTPAEAVHPDELAAVGERFLRLTSGEVDRDIITTRIRHKGGHYVWAEIKLALVRDPETRQPTSIISVMRDVTERKAHADALFEANAELRRLMQHMARTRDAAEQASKGKSRILADVSHELRTTLNYIMAHAQLLQITGGLSPAQSGRVESMLTAGRQLLDTSLNRFELEADALQESSLRHPSPGCGLRALVVDDVAVNRDVVATFLSEAGHLVTCAEGGQEAVLLASMSDFDVILMDVRMPDIDGLEAARRIRAFAGPRGRVPIVAMTAQGVLDDFAQCRDAGMDHHLLTPFTRLSLLEALRRAVAAVELT